MSYYKDRIKVVCPDMMCFPVDAKTLEPLACSCYDPYAWSDPDHDAIETISQFDLNFRRGECHPDFYRSATTNEVQRLRGL
jgi:hypothetical protein